MVWIGLARVAWPLLATGVLAQAHSPCFPTVVDAQGQPMAGAEVTCVSTPDALTPWAADVVTAVSDARGLAPCELQVGRLYTAWAIGPADADGDRRVTVPLPCVTVGRVFDLVAGERLARRLVGVQGLDAWRQAGARLVRWYPDALEAVHVDLPLPEGDTVELPPSPWSRSCVALCDAAGEPMVTTGVNPRSTRPLNFQPLIEVTLTVVDATGDPVAGARIEHRVDRRAQQPSGLASFCERPWMRFCGLTDADGGARFVMAKEAREGCLFISRPGYGCALVPVDEHGQARCTLRPQRSVSVQVRGEQCVEFAASGVHTSALPGGTQWHAHARLSVDPLAEGGWVVHGAPDQWSPFVRLQGDLPTFAVLNPVVAADATVAIEIGRRVDVSVCAAAGGPCAATLCVLRVDDFSADWCGFVGTDIGGRAALRVPDGTLAVYATTGGEHALAMVEPGVEGVRLQLAATPVMRILVRRPSGAAVEGASVSGTNIMLDRVVGRGLAEVWARVGGDLTRAFAATARSDAQGVLLVPAFVQPRLTCSVRIYADRAESQDVQLEPGGEAIVTLR